MRQPALYREGKALKGEARDKARDKAETTMASGELEGAQDLGRLSLVKGVLPGLYLERYGGDS